MPPLMIAVIIASFAIGPFFLLPMAANSAENIRQYRAAMTKIFLWKYSALPIYRLNPLFPGDVILLKNETKYLAHKRCFKNMKGGNYRGIQRYTDGMQINLSVDLKIKGELLHEKIAKINAEGKGKIEDVGSITVSPLSVDSVVPDSKELYHIGPDPACSIIPDILDAKKQGFAVADSVLHGQVNVTLKAKLSGSFGAGAEGELARRISSVFGLRQADVRIVADSVSFAVSESPQPMTLAIVPAKFSKEELARITHYLQGERGVDLEIAVREAIATDDLGRFEKFRISIESLLKDEIKNKERWAENFVNGKSRMTVAELRTLGPDNVDLGQVANYAAAMELVRLEAPSRLQ